MNSKQWVKESPPNQLSGVPNDGRLWYFYFPSEWKRCGASVSSTEKSSNCVLLAKIKTRKSESHPFCVFASGLPLQVHCCISSEKKLVVNREKWECCFLLVVCGWFFANLLMLLRSCHKMSNRMHTESDNVEVDVFGFLYFSNFQWQPEF